MDQRQGGLALRQVVTQVLAQLGRIGGVVQHVVGDLECEAQVHAVLEQLALEHVARAGCQRAQLGSGGEQHRGLAFDHIEVRGLVGVGVVHVQQLQHLALGDAVGGVGEDLHDLHTVQLHHQLEAARIQEVPHQHAGRIAPQRIGGAATAALVGLVDHVVVQQGGGVDEFDDRGQLVVFGGDAPAGAAGKAHQHRPQALAAGRDDVIGNLVDQDHVRGQARADQCVDGGHVGPGEGLDLAQGQGGPGGIDGGHGANRMEVAEL